jgi:class 3 adenylate cyclase/tetratricopeptide (TPR) repeat protein
VGVCAACGRENPPDARFCNECGAGLLAAPAPRQQRKTVTVLFCDVTGSTALGELLDPESFREVMRHYFDAARQVIERHGGTVEKFIGDAVMAVFGVPVLHEDDALRAVRAAAELRDEIAGLNATLEARFGASVSIRTGVNTGQVVTGTAERLATGDAVNLAARLEQAASPGEVVIGPQTWRLVRDAVTAEPLEPLRLKGKSQPVAAYRLLQVASAAEPRARAGVPLVGRHSELRLLGDAFAHIVRERSCGLFTVLGTAGVGKSRLAAEFLGGVDARVVTGRCLPYGEGITYWPVVSMVKQLLDAKRGCAAATKLMAGDARVAAAVKLVLGEQVAVTSPTEIAWAVRKLFEASAGPRGLVVVVDDLQWAQPVLLDLVEHIADFSRDAPMLVLCLARPELLERRAGWGGGKLNAASVLLEPLNAAETAALIDELTPAGSLDLQLRDRVRATAAGNPLFVEEILALMRESGSSDVVVPPTIDALLAARLDQLPARERMVLECGSVEGQSFHRGPVQALALDEPDVIVPLMTLVHQDLVRPDQAVFAGEEAFRFRHLLIRDAAYKGLAKADRAELHQRFARWLADHGAALVELDEIAGYHLEQAYRYRTELGPADGTARLLAAQGAGHLQAAGRRALDRGDLAAAVNMLERAEALLPPQQVNLTFQQGLIQGLGMSGRLEDAMSRAARVAADCSAAGNRIGELQARLLESVWRLSADLAGQFDQLCALVEEARPVIEHSGDPAAVAVLDYAAAHIPFTGNRFGAAFAALTRSMEHARKAGELWFEHHVRIHAAACLPAGPAPVGEGLRWLAQAQAQYATYEPVFDMHMVPVLGMAGRFGEARPLLTQLLDRLSERGLTLLFALAMGTAGEIEMLAGDLAAAEHMARQSCDQLERLGDRRFLSSHACLLADALYALGRYGEAGRWAQRGLELGGEEDVSAQLAGLSVQSKLLAREGDNIAALALAHHVEELAKASDSSINHGDAALNLAQVLYLTRDRAGAKDAVERAIACYERKGATAYVRRAQSLAAEWATKAG